MAAAVKLQLAPELDEQDRPRNDAVELLARPEHVGRAREHHREAVGIAKKVFRLMSAAARDTA